jgi:hypothetical protein
MLFGFRRMLSVSPHLVICALAALALTAPYWANAMLLGKDLSIVRQAGDVYFQELTANLNIFTPWLVSPDHFSLQLGPVIFGALFASLFYLGNSRIRTMILATAAASLVACSFFNLFPFWTMLPAQLTAIQFPYRMLVFASSFGLIAGGLILSSVARESRVYAFASFALLTFTLLSGFWWIPDISRNPTADLRGINFTNGGTAYFELGGSSAPPDSVPIARSIVQADNNIAAASLVVKQAGNFILPIQYSKFLSAFVNGVPASLSNSNGLISIALPEGPAEIRTQRTEPVGFLYGTLVSVGLTMMLGFLLRREHATRYHEAKSKSLG